MSDIRVSVTGPAPIAVRVTGATGVSPTITNGQTFRVNLAGVGPTGPRGEQGAVGPTGARGLDGTAASAGATGPSGPAGERGPTGSVGPQGIQGERGHTGPAGAAGSVGATGARGADGAVGPSGSVGPQGERGATGPAGEPGAVGATGARGADGAPGSVGATGARGPDGLSITGPSGPAGAVGPTGARGADGASITGPTGPAGGGGGGGAQEIFTATTTAGFPATGATGVYIATDSGRQYRFDSSNVYVEIGPDNGSTLWSLWLPPAPTGLTATAGAASASLSWTAPSVSQQTPIQDYRVQVSSDGGTTWTTFADGTTTSTIANVTGLTNGVSYVFRVAAVNAIGLGAYTAASSSATPIPVPQQIAGLQLWLDASDASSLLDATSGGSLVAADGAVARWQDKSGNARHATQATSGSRPLRKTAVQNGLGVLRFDGSNDSLSIASSTATFKFMHGTSATVFYVARYGTSSNPDAQYGLLSTGGATGNEIGYFHSYDDRSPSVNNAISSSAIRDASGLRAWLNRVGDRVTPNTFLACSEVIDAGTLTAANRSIVRINGGAAIQGNSLTNSPSGSDSQFDFTIGAIASSSLTAYMVGDIAEILIYNSALSDSDRAAVENYLIAKWGVS